MLGSEQVQAENKDRKQREQSVSLVAGNLVEGLELASSLAPQEEGGQWQNALSEYLSGAAKEALRNGDEETRRAWTHVVTGKWDSTRAGESVDPAIEPWAKAIASAVKFSWLFDEHYSGLVNQLNIEDYQALSQAMVLATRGIADSLRMLLVVGIPTLLFGGGVIALIVLFIDKG